MKTKPGEMTPTTLNWRERFNELFVEKVKVPSNTTSVTYKYSGLWKEDPCGGYETMTQPYQVEDFIAQLLESQTAEYVRRVEGLKKNEEFQTEYDYCYSYDKALDDVLAILNGKDTNE